MKLTKIKFVMVMLFALSTFVSAQNIVQSLTSPSYQTPDGINFVYTIAMTDSTGTTYSPAVNLHSYLPTSLSSNPITCYAIGSGTKDSVKIIVQGRMIKNPNGTATYSTWAPIDTVIINFTKVDGIAYPYTVNLNGHRPDQMRFQVTGASSVNRANVVITVIAELVKQNAAYLLR